MKDILEGVSPLPLLRVHHRGTKSDIKRGHDHYRIDVSDDIDSVGIHVHRGCFDKTDHEKVARFIAHAVNTYEAREALIAELVEALENLGNLTAADAARVASALTRAKEVMKG